ncbi:MAG: hypothetical protein NC818_04715 [Candidatus Omnitrophica bacterium]|nr:hypothetical protein [Candidatus Omnitrophota bacterium]
MKIIKFLFVIFILVASALLYVWQSIHQIELSYQILQREKIINNLVDQNRILKYNVAQLKSPSYLERKVLAKHTGLKYTKPIVIISESKKENLLSSEFTKTTFFWHKVNRLISRIFSGRSEAEAKP